MADKITWLVRLPAAVHGLKIINVILNFIALTAGCLGAKFQIKG